MPIAIRKTRAIRLNTCSDTFTNIRWPIHMPVINVGIISRHPPMICATSNPPAQYIPIAIIWTNRKYRMIDARFCAAVKGPAMRKVITGGPPTYAAPVIKPPTSPTAPIIQLLILPV